MPVQATQLLSTLKDPSDIANCQAVNIQFLVS